MSAASLYPYLLVAKTYLTLAAPYLALAAAVMALVLLVMQIRLRRRLARLALGRNGSIEETIAVLMRDMKEFKEFRTELEKYLKLAEGRLRGTVSGLGVVRFNPFTGEGQGGNQSFALTLLDEGGQGVVLSTLYARDRVGVYAKPLKAFASTYELSEEEKASVEKAREQMAAHRKA
ncbi:MAG: hypothetical protein JWL87_14 [Candidatus Adlerbacteria bacterium]|nr:hypothetical protein [Candidatus Adlerbacteria bacterium]